MKREFICTSNGRTLHYCAFNSGGRITATAGDVGDTVFHPVTLENQTLKLARRLFGAEQPKPVPHWNLDVGLITDVDACDFVDLDSYFSDRLERLSLHLSRLDLQRESNHALADECVGLAREWMDLARKAARLNRATETMTAANMQSIANGDPEDSPQFFETSWGEGPFTVAEIEKMVEKDPRAARRFHTNGNVSYEEYRQMAPPADATCSLASREEAKLVRQAGFAVGLAASLVAIVSWMVHGSR